MKARILTESERVDWLCLSRSEGVGPVTFFELLKRFGSAQAALRALPSLVSRSKRLGKIHNRGEAEAEIRRLEKMGGRLLTPVDPEYSPALNALDPPPPVLSAIGDIGLLARPASAIVGSRNASAAGLQLAHTLAAGLGEAGYVIASGLARGIDAAAHRGGMASGTIAVLAGGIDHIYPPEHAGLYAEIAEKGLLLAENALGAPPTSRDFPRRNRIVTGLSLGVVVVEAAMGSGSLISARTAAEQNREVMAVPGSPLDPRARGVNDLIRNGATLVENAAHVREVLDPIRGSDLHRERFTERDETEFSARMPKSFTPAPDETLVRVRALLSATPVHLDVLLAHSGASAGEFSAALVELELCGDAMTLPGGYVASVPGRSMESWRPNAI